VGAFPMTPLPCSAMSRAKYVSSVIEPASPWSNPKSSSTAACTAAYEPCIPISGSPHSRHVEPLVQIVIDAYEKFIFF